MKSLKKACTLRASSIGDCLMGKYWLEQIHAAYPDAVCSVVVASRGDMIRDLFAAYPWLTVHEASRRNLGGLFRTLVALWGSDATMTQYTSRGTFSGISKLFARLVTRPGRLVGFSDPWKWNRYIFDYVLPYEREKVFLQHEQAALKVLGVPIATTALTLMYVPDATVPERFSLSPHSYLCLHLFAGTAGRGFTREKRSVYVREAVARFGSVYTIVLTGSKTDAVLAHELAQEFPVRVVAGETSVQELANILVSSAGVISVDTGVAHMAAQLGVPLVVVGTCLADQWWKPEQYAGPVSFLTRADLCTVGHLTDKATNCLNSVEVSNVMDAAYTRINSTS